MAETPMRRIGGTLSGVKRQRRRNADQGGSERDKGRIRRKTDAGGAGWGRLVRMTTMELKNKRVLVVGLGKSGLAAALFLRDRGARVTVSDTRSAAALGDQIPALLEAGIMVEAGGHGLLTFRRQDLIVVSPGVPLDTPEVKQAAQFGLPVIGELELASRFLLGDVVAITGSNGKTTTTTLIGEIFKDAGLTTQVGGNIGLPVIELIAGSAAETWNVLEVSSFQLETTVEFKPKIALVLNITPDHLDRHKTFEAYRAAKAKITANQGPEDFLVLNAEDVASQGVAAKTRAKIYWFSGARRIKQGAFVHGESVFFVGEEGGTPEPVLPVEHRLELVRTVRRVEYYNDSKATNVDATKKAVASFAGGIHLILGGKDKDSDYTALVPLLRERVKAVYTIGSAAEKIERELAGVVKIVAAGTLDAAVAGAAGAAVSGDVVLLAPACSSFDQFENYEHRGRAFREAVLGLEG